VAEPVVTMRGLSRPDAGPDRRAYRLSDSRSSSAGYVDPVATADLLSIILID